MNEELEAVKDRISSTVIKLPRINGKTQFARDIRWLIKQAERVDELEEENERLHEMI